MSKEIFISYRRKDTGSSAGRLYDALAESLGKRKVFKDIDNIGPGVDFRKVIGRELLNSKVVLLLIGDRYTSITDENDNPRIKRDDDFVREEVAVALTFRDNKLVVPILVDGAPIPKKEDLPEDLHDLAYLNAMTLSYDRWNEDVKNLTKEIKNYLNPTPDRGHRKPPPERKNSNARTVGIMLTVLTILILGIIFIPSLLPEYEPDPLPPEPIGTTELDFTGQITATQLNLRDAPGTNNSNVLFALNYGELVQVDGSREDDDGKIWYLVDYNGTMGWASSNYITPANNSYTPPPPKKVTKPRSYTLAERIKGRWQFDEYYYNGQYSTSPYLGTIYNFQDNVVTTERYGQVEQAYSYSINNQYLFIDGVALGYTLFDDVLEIYAFENDLYGNQVPITSSLTREY